MRTLTREDLMALAIGAGLRDVRCANYLFTVALDLLMKSSFPRPGDGERVRAMFEADVGANRMGLSLSKENGGIELTYPVLIVSGAKVS